MESMSNLLLVDSRHFTRSPAILSAVALTALALFIRCLLNRRTKLNLPVVGKSGCTSYKNDLLEGVSRYPDTPFIIPVSPPLVILPISVLDEVRNLPEDQVSLRKEIGRMFVSNHTGIGDDTPEAVLAVKLDLTRHIASTLDGLQDEIRYSFNKELGPCENWKPVVLYEVMARIVALLSGRVFVGRPLSRNEEWIDSTIKYTVDCIKARDAITKYPVYLRGLVAPFLPEIRRVRKYRARGGKLLEPLLKATLARAHKEKPDLSFDDEQVTFISWILKHTTSKSREDPEVLAQIQMVLSFAAIHTTTMATTHAMFDLASRPEYIQPLRDEIQMVIDEDGEDLDGDGFLKLKKTSMTKLRKLDSFLKESQRVSPPGLVSNIRVTTAPLTLSTGHTLPKGTRIGFASHAVHTSPSTKTFSPSYNPPTAKPPSEFDGFRFYNLRAMKGKENKHQFVTTSPDSLVFGHGNHACPGRFFASNEIKVVMIELLRSWDFRLKGDVEMQGGEEKRPKSYEHEMSLSPNMSAEIEFRRRQVSVSEQEPGKGIEEGAMNLIP